VGRGIDELTLRDARSELPALLSVLLLPWAILLIPCANIAGMLLARAAARRAEIATRLAIGAARRRLIRQLLTESVLLAGIGGVLAIFLCYAANRFAIRFEIPFALDLNVLLFTAGLSIATGLLFGLAPALIATRVDLISVAKQESAAIQGRLNLRMGKALVAFQVTLSFLLLIIAGLQVRSMLNLMDVHVPDPERVLMLGVDGRSGEYTDERLQLYFQESTARLQGLPGVASASIAGMGLGIRTTQNFSSLHLSVGPGYFDTMNVPLLAGRDLEWTDRPADAVVVNDAFARKYFPDANPLGQIVPGFGQIVGVVGNSRVALASGLSRGAGVQPTAYMPLSQKIALVWVLIRANGNPSTLIAPTRRVMDEVDSQIPIDTVYTLADQMSFGIRERRVIVGVFSSFGLIALLQAACGIYGTMSYFVHRRTPEIGLRMALGARRYHVVRLVIRQSIIPVLIGVLLGAAVAPILANAMQGEQDLMVGTVTATDQLAIIGSVSLLVIAAIFAAWAPAWRATRIDPMQALRHE
jgi:predicted permease